MEYTHTKILSFSDNSVSDTLQLRDAVSGCPFASNLLEGTLATLCAQPHTHAHTYTHTYTRTHTRTCNAQVRGVLVCELGIVTASRDKTIKIWVQDGPGFTCIATLVRCGVRTVRYKAG
eukprot:1161522-Pelagomonas_calceolata.AAC.4